MLKAKYLIKCKTLEALQKHSQKFKNKLTWQKNKQNNSTNFIHEIFKLQQNIHKKQQC